MTAPDLVRRERMALDALQSAPEGDAILDAHRRWLDARRGLQARIHRDGSPIEHRGPRSTTTYTLDPTGQLCVLTSTQGRIR